MKAPFKQNIVLVISYLLILLFLYAAANKLMDYQKFQVQLGQSPILTGFAPFVAWFIPAIEVIISVLLIFQGTRLIGLYASFSLMVMFSAYIFIVLKFAVRVPCSCGGILDKMGWTEHLIFNLVFVLLAAVGIILQSGMKSNRPPITEPLYL